MLPRSQLHYYSFSPWLSSTLVLSSPLFSLELSRGLSRQTLLIFPRHLNQPGTRRHPLTRRQNPVQNLARISSPQSSLEMWSHDDVYQRWIMEIAQCGCLVGIVMLMLYTGLLHGLLRAERRRNIMSFKQTERPQLSRQPL